MAAFRKLTVLCHRTRSAAQAAAHSSTAGRDMYDLVIVGGGMVGMALATAVGQASAMNNARVLLLEASSKAPPTTTPTQPYSNRVCALSLGTVEFLKSFGVWSEVSAIRAKYFKRIHVWDSCSPAVITFSTDDLTDSQFDITTPDQFFEGSHDPPPVTAADHDIMGYIVENDVLLRALSNKVEKDCNIEIRKGVTLESMDYTHSKEEVANPWLSVNLADGTGIATKLLVGADGSESRVRQLAGFQDPVKWNYNQSAVVATLTIEEGLDENCVAWQRFLPDGPIALLPLSDTHCSLVWSTTPDHAKQLLEMTTERFVDSVNTALFEEFPYDDVVSSANKALKSAISFAMPSAVPVKQLPPTVAGVESDSRAMFPLAFSHCPNYVKPRVALIGDAAHRVHPLAGLGVNLGFSDVILLHQRLRHSSSVGGDWGNLTSLLTYERQSQAHNVPVMAAIDGLQRLFSTSSVPIVALRSLGLQLTSAIQPIKELIVKYVQRNY